MKTTYIKRYNKKHLIKEETATHQNTAKQDIPTMFQPLLEIPDYEPQIIDQHYQQDPEWKDDLYDQEKLEYRHNFNTPAERIEVEDIIRDQHVSDKLRYPLIDFWTINPQLPNISPILNFKPPPNFTNFKRWS